MTVTHQHFASTLEYADWATNHQADMAANSRYGSYGNPEQVARAIKLLREGDETHVADAERLLEQLRLNVETPTFTWQPDMVGAFPNVPAYCAGEPEDMYTKAIIHTDRTPLRIWLGVTSQWDITEAQLRKRGVALCALGMALSEVRPVYITPYVNQQGGSYYATKHSILSWDIMTSPLVLGELLSSISDPLITRHLGIAACYELDYSISRGGSFLGVRKEHLTDAPDDLWLPPISTSDPLLTNPVAWIQKQVARYTPEFEEGWQN